MKPKSTTFLLIFCFVNSILFSQTTSDEPTINFKRSKLIVRIDVEVIKFVFQKDVVRIKSKKHLTTILKRTLYENEAVNQILLYNNEYSVITAKNNGKTVIAFQTDQQCPFVFKKIAFDSKSKKQVFVHEWKGISYNKAYN